MPSWMKWGIALLIGLAIIVVGFRWAGWLLRGFFVMNCLVLMIVVLLQSGKAADLAGAFGGAGSQTAFGPRGAASILSQATTWCAIMFMICAMALVVRVDQAVESGGSVLQQSSRAAKKPTAPAQQTPAPPSSTPQSPTPAAPAPAQSSTPQSSTPATPTPQSSAPASTSTPGPAKPASQPPSPTKKP